VRGKRDRIASPHEAAHLLAALPEEDQALWATALYAGLRQGELRALDWSHVDLPNGRIQVERSLDAKGTFVDPKSRAGKRTVPIPKILRQLLLAHRLRSGRSQGLVFQNNNGQPFNPGTANNRANRAWKCAQLQPIGMHECRHTFASLMIAAGVNAKALSTFMGHANISITMDRYGHLMPGSEEEAATRLDAYLEEAVGS
jgi:integrase